MTQKEKAIWHNAREEEPEYGKRIIYIEENSFQGVTVTEYSENIDWDEVYLWAYEWDFVNMLNNVIF